jgi:hypothetical protein
MTTSWVRTGSFAAALQPPVGKRRILMRAGVVDREHLAVIGVEHRDRWIRFDPARLTARQGRQRTDFEHERDLPGVT